MAKISLIIRTYNEGYWVPILIDSLKKQTEQDFEVIQVDNHSSDHSIVLFEESGLNHTLVYIKEYLPGLALNKGIHAAKGDFIVFLSAHCIPNSSTWMSELVTPLEDGSFQAVYGRQIPCKSSHPEDKRDLLLSFPVESRVQHADSFFHNANSAITKKIWARFPFSSTLTNIEDRIFGKQLIEASIPILYNHKASVVHYHGLHQTGNIRRLKGVTRILEENGILPYEDPSFIDIPKKCLKVSIASNDLEAAKKNMPDGQAILITNDPNYKEDTSCRFYNYGSHEKVLNILFKFFLNHTHFTFDYIYYKEPKYWSNQDLNLESEIHLSDLVITHGEEIDEHLIEVSLNEKKLLTSYSRNRKSQYYRLNLNKGLIIHRSIIEMESIDSLIKNIRIV